MYPVNHNMVGPKAAIADRPAPTETPGQSADSRNNGEEC